jgi:hypothetical protein
MEPEETEQHFMEPRGFIAGLPKSLQWRPIVSRNQSIVFGMIKIFAEVKNQDSSAPGHLWQYHVAYVSNRNATFGQEGEGRRWFILFPSYCTFASITDQQSNKYHYINSAVRVFNFLRRSIHARIITHSYL